MEKSPEVKVYSKEHCVQCDATYRALGKRAIAYKVIMLEDHPELVEQFRGEGYLQAPIVDTGTEKWSGFRPDKISQIEQ